MHVITGDETFHRGDVATERSVDRRKCHIAANARMHAISRDRKPRVVE